MPKTNRNPFSSIYAQILLFLHRLVYGRAWSPDLYAFGFNRWKTFIDQWLGDRKVHRTPYFITKLQFLADIDFALRWKWLIRLLPETEVIVWQYKGPSKLADFCARHAIPLAFVEDGFIRSVSLGAMHTPPLSLVFDRRAPYFNAHVETDLEILLKTYDFAADVNLMERARGTMKSLLDSRLSKYNLGARRVIADVYGEKISKRILVVGQVERDASIRFGCDRVFRNNDLVRLAASENPDAQIIYKPHPENLHGTAENISNPEDVASICQILREDISLADAFETVDHVYTITSLSGFEALMRGIKVTTVGCPFYAGWGLTDERQPNARRGRKLTVEEVFAGAYILYAQYFDPNRKTRIEIEDAIARLNEMKAKAA